MTFNEYNDHYNEIEGYNIIKEYCDTPELQEWFEMAMDGYYVEVLNEEPIKDSKNRTKAEADKYFEDLTRKLSAEYTRRGMSEEARSVLLPLVLYPKRQTKAQFLRTLIPHTVDVLMSDFSFSKSKATGLARVMSRLLSS